MAIAYPHQRAQPPKTEKSVSRAPLLTATSNPQIRTQIYNHLDYITICRLAMTSRHFAATTTNHKNTMSPDSKLADLFRAETEFARHWPRSCPACTEKETREKQTTYNEQHQGLIMTTTTASSTTTNGSCSTPKQHDPYCNRDGAMSQGNFACYMLCHRIREPEHFEMNQTIWFVERMDGKLEPYEEGQTVRWPSKRVSLRRFCIECGLRMGIYERGRQILTKANTTLWVCGCLKVHRKGDDHESRQCKDCMRCCTWRSIRTRKRPATRRK